MLIVIARWVLVLPAAIIAYIVAHTLIYWVSKFMFFVLLKIPSPWPNILESIATWNNLVVPVAFASVVFIFVGAVVAPYYRGFASIFLFTVHVAVGTFIVTTSVVGIVQDYSLSQVLVVFIFNLIGGGVGLYLVITKYGWSRITEP